MLKKYPFYKLLLRVSISELSLSLSLSIMLCFRALSLTTLSIKAQFVTSITNEREIIICSLWASPFCYSVAQEPIYPIYIAIELAERLYIQEDGHSARVCVGCYLFCEHPMQTGNEELLWRQKLRISKTSVLGELVSEIVLASQAWDSRHFALSVCKQFVQLRKEKCVSSFLWRGVSHDWVRCWAGRCKKKKNNKKNNNSGRDATPGMISRQ